MPRSIGDTIESALRELHDRSGLTGLSSWTESDIAGHFIRSEILRRIGERECFVADVTRLNFNVTYEVGYAIGLRKRLILVRNLSVAPSPPTTTEVGIFDSLGYLPYENSTQLAGILREISAAKPLGIPPVELNRKAHLPASRNGSWLALTRCHPGWCMTAPYQLLVEGNSICSTERICGIDKNTIMRLLVLAGERCERLMAERIQNVRVDHLELDEVWAYVGCHQRFVDHERDDANLRGDQYTFIALESRTKMVMAFHLGKRNLENTNAFVAKIRHATAADHLFDVSTDAFAPYEVAIDGGLFERANHAQIVKLFSRHIEEGRERYSPARFVSVAKDAVTGMPDLDRASTSHVERKNGSLRQWCKRLTRLTYAYSKKWEHLQAALALHFAYYDFCRIHRSLRVTPGMEAGIIDHIWTLKELMGQ